MRLKGARIQISVCLTLAAAVLLAGAPAFAQGGDPNECDTPGDVPDVIVGDMPAIQRWGTFDPGDGSGLHTSFSVATTSCNIGTCWLEWFELSDRHPVIGANAYRLEDGRMEQIGQSWLKHGFFALSEELCESDCENTNGTYLGVNCSDPYSSFLNGIQGGLGPKFEVNAWTGDFPWPFTDRGQSGGTGYKRLQIDNDDLDPIQHPNARYFIEGHYVTPDDAAAGRGENNTSYREVWVVGANGFYNLQFDDPNSSASSETVRQRSAILAWKNIDPSIQLTPVRIPDEGLFWVGSKATDIGGGWWNYEFALYNMNSHKSGGAFRVPLPFGAQVQNVDFHDVRYHSGEPYTPFPWQSEVVTDQMENYIEFFTQTESENANANAIRWGTLYNFRFDANVPPTKGDAMLTTWRQPVDMVSVRADIPALCDNDGVCEFGEDCDSCPNDCNIGPACCGDDVCDPAEDKCNCAQDCGLPLVDEATCDDGIDDDCDGNIDCEDSDCCGEGGCGDGVDGDGDTFGSCADCDDGNSNSWRHPSEVQNLLLDETTETQLTWSPPTDPGTIDIFDYVALRSDLAGDFVGATDCLSTSGATASDATVPTLGALFYYLVYAENACPGNGGSLGQDSDGVEREGRVCP